MAFIDYYKIMGVGKDTPQEKIKAAYKKRTKQFHPDLHPNDPKAKAKFQALNEAYDVLSDPQKRAKYDQYGQHWKNMGNFGGTNETGGYSDADGFDFNQFGGGGGFSDFFEQLFGGSRARANANSGFGNSGGFNFGGFGNQASGSRCGGSGCHSQHSPAETQASIDLDMYTALLGGEVIVQIAGSKLKLKIKPGTQPGTKVRLKGKGSATGTGIHSDLILTYNVKLPSHLSERQKELLRQMQQS